MVCTRNSEVSWRCGSNHLGEGNFFIIVAGQYLQRLTPKVGGQVHFRIEEAAYQRGVEVPEELQVFLSQDEESKKVYSLMPDGKKRSLIHSLIKLKNMDIQVKKFGLFSVKNNQTKNEGGFPKRVSFSNSGKSLVERILGQQCVVTGSLSIVSDRLTTISYIQVSENGEAHWLLSLGVKEMVGKRRASTGNTISTLGCPCIWVTSGSSLLV